MAQEAAFNAEQCRHLKMAARRDPDNVVSHLGDIADEDLCPTIRNDEDAIAVDSRQELRRNFNQFSAIAFNVILQGAWEVILVASTEGLGNGGVAGMFWSYVWTFAGMTLVTLSLAEMASMTPGPGGPYYWVARFAPPQWRSLLSYLTGWMSAMAWQAGAASGPFIVGTLLRSLIELNTGSYHETGWYDTLFVWLVASVVHFGNCYGRTALPVVQNFMLILHVLAFLIISISLCVYAPHNDTFVVLTSFTNNGGWPYMALSVMIGQSSALYACGNPDAVAYLSDEAQDAACTIPRIMVSSHLLSGSLGLVFLVIYLFCMVDVRAAINDKTGYPFLFVFRKAFNLTTVDVFTVVVLVLISAGTLSYNLSSSRQMFAFARDGGLPFSAWIAELDSKSRVPRNAISITTAIVFILSLINIGSPMAFKAIISLDLACFMSTYMASIACLLYHRFRKQGLEDKSLWSLGLWGPVVNVGAFCYTAFVFFWSFWPDLTPVTLENFNWAPLMFSITLVVAYAFWLWRARHTYVPPDAGCT